MVQIADVAPPSGMAGDFYDFTLTAADGAEPYAWDGDDANPLPAGLTLGPTGRISGRPVAAGTTRFTAHVTDRNQQTSTRDFTIIVGPRLTILDDISPSSSRTDAGHAVLADLRAAGGVPPYRWAPSPESTWPAWLDQIDPDSGRISGALGQPGRVAVRVQVSDDGHRVASADYVIRSRLHSRWRHPIRRRRKEYRANIARLLIAVGSSWRARLRHVTVWLGFLGIMAPLGGTIWLVVYSFYTPGPHPVYLGTGVLVSLAAFVAGCFVGFLFGIPRVVSSGELRQKGSDSSAPGLPGSSASTNLAEVSDWLTKLVLGAGLVELTRLGTPLGKLIDAVAASLYSAPAGASTVHAAKVMAGALLFGYVTMGLLDGYIVTTTWYQNKITKAQ
jgi:hypothetical protein